MFLVRRGIYVDYAIDEDLRPTPFIAPSTEPPFDHGPNKEMDRSFVNDIVEDRTLDGAVQMLCGLYSSSGWRGKGWISYSISSILDTEYNELDSVRVKVVEYLVPREAEWQAWPKDGLNAIDYFWFNVPAGKLIEGLFTAMMAEGEEAFAG